DVVLEKLALTGLRVEMVGDGPHVALSGLSLYSDASIDTKDLRANLKLAIAPADTKPNLVVALPQPAVSAELALAFTATAALAARSSDGLDLDRFELGTQATMH